ncbi:MAG: AcvB/VirJ family lysyl-phosphatidylglycerol hydrolase [Thermoanaerobaculia bacterium]
MPAAKPVAPQIAVFLSGDGGWRAIDQETSDELNRHGISVVGVKSDEYFGTRRNPEEVGRDVEALIETYAAKWKKRDVILIGYSRGADALPVAIAHMSAKTKSRIVLAAMLGPATFAELEKIPWWSRRDPPPPIALAPIVRRQKDVRYLCVHGEDEDDSLCDALRGTGVLDVKTQGAHHFDRDYEALARTILGALPKG